MFSNKYQISAIRQVQDSLGEQENLNADSRIFTVIAFASLIGGNISEYNLLLLLKYCGIDIDDNDQLALTKNLLSFYCGAKIIDIIDNGLGIAELIKDPMSSSFQKGLDADTSKIVDQINRLQKSLVESMVRGSEAYEEEKDWISNLP